MEKLSVAIADDNEKMVEMLGKLIEEDKAIDDIIKEAGIENITDTTALREVIKKIISENESSVNDYKAGHDRDIKYFMGQIMKETKGSANPKLAMNILIEELD